MNESGESPSARHGEARHAEAWHGAAGHGLDDLAAGVPHPSELRPVYLERWQAMRFNLEAAWDHNDDHVVIPIESLVELVERVDPSWLA